MSESKCCLVPNGPDRSHILPDGKAHDWSVIYDPEYRNQVRRLLRQSRTNGDQKNVTEIALDHGFWHLGRFSS